MNLRRVLPIVLLSFSFGATVASASPVVYQLNVNTSSIAGTVGSLDFNFNPGPLTTQAASVQIVNFSGNGSLVGSPVNTGDAGGSLPAVLTFDNGTGYNDYFQDYKYGSTLSFAVSFYGAALSAPNGTATSGSAFAFSLFSDAAGTIPVLTSDTTDGFAYTVNVNFDGSTTATNYSSQLAASSPSQVPEPNSLTLAGTGILLLACLMLQAYAGRVRYPRVRDAIKAGFIAAGAAFMVAAPARGQQPQRPIVDINGVPIRKASPSEGIRPQIHTNAVQSSASNDGPPAGAILDLNGTPVPGGGNITYQMYTATFSAMYPNTAVTFAFREDPAFLYFSNPSVTDMTTGSGNLLTNADFSGATYTSNGNTATPVGWTYANVYGATYGGVVTTGCGAAANGAYGTGNCWYDGAVQAYDALTQTIATTVGHQYKITFYLADNSECNIDGGAPCNFSELSTNGDTTDTGGNGINLTVYVGAALPAPAAIHLQLGRDASPSNQGMLALASAMTTNGTADNMNDAATKVGFDHFNWIQKVVSDLDLQGCATAGLPIPPACLSYTKIDGTLPVLQFFDAPSGGYAYQYWATYCPNSFPCNFATAVRDNWPMYWDEYFSDGPPYVPSPANPLYRSNYRTSSTLANMGNTNVTPSTALGFAFSDRPVSNFIATGSAGSPNTITFVTALVGVSGTCNALSSTNCTFQLFPGTTFKWTSTNGVISFAATPGASPLAAGIMNIPERKTAEQEDYFPANPVDLSGAELANSLISVDQFLSLANLTPQSLAAMGGSVSIFSGSLIPSQAAALAAVQAGGTLVQPTQLTATASGLAYSRVSRTFNGTVTLTNISGNAISGPFQVLFNGMPATVTLVHSTGSLAGTSYLTVPTGSLAPGQSITVSVQFNNPSNAVINITPSVYYGVFQ